MAIRQRNDPLRLFWRRLMVAGLFLLVLAAGWGVMGAHHKKEESAQLRQEAELQLMDLSDRQAKLDSDIAKLKTSRGMEEVLREQYALAGQGEGLIVIVDPPKSVPIQATSTFIDKLKKAFRWW